MTYDEMHLIAKASGFNLHYGTPHDTYTLDRPGLVKGDLETWHFTTLEHVCLFLMGFNARKVPATDTPFVREVCAEVSRARQLFSGRQHMVLALAEEAGEVVKAAMDVNQAKGATLVDLRRELVQVAAMAYRVYEEGDATLGIPIMKS